MHPEKDDVSIPCACILHSSFPLSLIIGNEIQMYAIETARGALNAALAYGIALFELVRIYHSLRASP